MRALLLILALSATAAAADPAPVPLPAAPALPAPPAPTGDLKKLQGLWKPESIRHSGTEQMPDPKARSLVTLFVKDAEYRLFVAKDAEAVAADKHVRLATADITLNETDKSFTLAMKGGARKGAKLHGLYDLAGGKLRLCYGPADKPRPTAFDSPKSADVFLEVWAPEKDTPAAK